MRLIPWSVSILAPLVVFGETKFTFHGKGWMDYGRIMNAEDTIVNTLNPEITLNYNGNALQSVGGQITVLADLSDHLEAGLGYGAAKGSHSLGNGPSEYLT